MSAGAGLPQLQRPLQLGTLEIRNRIVSTSHQTTLVHDHLPTDDFVAYHEARARGGVGLIVLEATAIDPTGLLTPHTLGGYLPAIVEGYRRLAPVRAHGARVIVQLFHGGREQIATAPRAPAVAPSAVPSPRFRTEPRALTAEEIEGLIVGYATAAGHAAEGDLDGVEITAAHGYLIEQFADPALNRRDDRWARPHAFLEAVVAAVRDAAPSLCLGVRLSADSPLAPALASAVAGSVDYLSIALGRSSTLIDSVGIVPPPPIEQNAIVPVATASFRIGPPLIATSRVVDPAAAERLVADGIADAVGMTRALIADPDLPVKAFSHRGSEVIRCNGCNACIAHYHAGTPIACAVNPRTGRERSLPRPVRVAAARRIVVVGAGPAGLAAAVEAASGGHRVTLLEREARLGGQLALAGAAPGGAELARTCLEDLEKALAGSHVDVRVSTPADAQVVRSLEPEGVVLATGAIPYRPELALDSVPTMHAWDVLGGEVPHGRRVVVADWGGDQVGLDAAELLAATGLDVTLAVASVTAGEGVHQYRRNLYLQRLYRADVTIAQHLTLVRAEAGRVVFGNTFAPELETPLAADALVLALGRVPAPAPGGELVGAGVRLERAGDCLAPRSLEEAILEGTLAVRRVLS